MKKILSIIMAIMAIMALTSASAKKMDVRNTAGTEMTIQISNLEGTQLTFVRTSDNREFTIPLSMLDQESQKQITQWEIETKYMPDSAPFFKMGEEFIIPINIEGDEVIYYDTKSQKKTLKYGDAIKLQKLVESNKEAMAKQTINGFENVRSIRNHRDNITLVHKKGATGIFNGGDKQFGEKIVFDQKTMAVEKSRFIQKVSYEIFLPEKIEKMPNPNQPVSEFFSTRDIGKAPIRLPIPNTLQVGKWVKNKAIVAADNESSNIAIFNSSKSLPIGIRNLEFNILEPQENIVTISDLIEGYNLFTSWEPFEIVPLEDQSVELKFDSPLRYNLELYEGYIVEISADYENGDIKAEPRIQYGRSIDEEHPSVEELNLKTKKQNRGSRSMIDISFNTHEENTVIITLDSRGRDNMILHKFDVSIRKPE